MNKLAPTTTTTSIDGWSSVPETNGTMLRGRVAKFKDGKFFADKIDDITGTTLVAVDVATAWLKWWDARPAEHRITRPGERHPDRDELGDLDEMQWQDGLNGEPADPWRDTRYLYLIDPLTAEEITFVTDSAGGRRAVSDLRRQIANMRRAHPAALPVVKLEAGSMSTRFGVKPKPDFRVIDWKRHEPAANEATASARPTIAPPTGRRDDMDDEIPF